MESDSVWIVKGKSAINTDTPEKDIIEDQNRNKNRVASIIKENQLFNKN